MGCTQEALGGVAQGLHMGCGGLWGAAGGSVRGERGPPRLAAEWGGGVSCLSPCRHARAQRSCPQPGFGRSRFEERC